MGKKNNLLFKISYKIWLTAAILCGILGIFLLQSTHQGNKATTPLPQERKSIINTLPDSYPEFFRNIYTQLQSEQSNFTKTPSIKNDDIWWISTDRWNLLVPSKYLVTVNVRPVKNSPNQEVMTKLQKIVNDEMVKNGWKSNTINSSTSQSDTRFYDYVQAYEKDELKCVATTSPDVGSSGDEEFYSTFKFGCFDNTDLQKAYDAQTPFLKGLNEKDSVVRDIKIKGPRASLTVHWRRTGAVGWMYNENGVWKKVIVTQAVPECTDLEKNGVPQEFWIDCYNSLSTGEIRKGSFDF